MQNIDDLRRVLTSLVRGVEAWGNDEDGIPPELWDTYAEAKTLIGEPVKVQSNFRTY